MERNNSTLLFLNNSGGMLDNTKVLSSLSLADAKVLLLSMINVVLFCVTILKSYRSLVAFFENLMKVVNLVAVEASDGTSTRIITTREEFFKATTRSTACSDTFRLITSALIFPVFETILRGSRKLCTFTSFSPLVRTRSWTLVPTWLFSLDQWNGFFLKLIVRNENRAFKGFLGNL